MKLITKTLMNRFNEVGEQNITENPIVIAKFFNPCGSGTWYATEYNPETNICFGYVKGPFGDQWNTFFISELESAERHFGISIERDIYFKEILFEDLIKKKTS
jgi:hypothetical protein